MSIQQLPVTFICLNWTTTFENGCLVLPREFTDEYAETLPAEVLLNVPCGDSWMATFDRNKGTVEGLHPMIRKYGLNQFNMPLIQYNGGGQFEVRIFNCYAVEIDYSFANVASQNCLVCNRDDLSMQQIDVDKFKVTFKFNVSPNNLNNCQVKIDTNHLSKEGIYQILSRKHVRELDVSESTKFIHVGFALKKWEIEVLKVDEQMFFGHGWNEFAKSAGLSVGDICCFKRTEIANSFEVAIFHMNQVQQWNPPSGEELCRSRTCFLHITNQDSLFKAEIVLPRVFAEKYGQQLESIVSLWMANNNIWITSFRKKDNCLIGLDRLLNYYKIQPQSFIVFQYCGKSTFYVSILRPDGYDIFNWSRNKMLVSDVVMDDDSFEEISCAERMSDEEDNSESSVDVERQSFTVSLTSCNFDERCHGVYIPRRLTKFYESWEPGVLVTLSYENQDWEVKGNMAGKQCRLGKGWSDFIRETDFAIGQRLTFSYVVSSILKFEIMV